MIRRLFLDSAIQATGIEGVVVVDLYTFISDTEKLILQRWDNLTIYTCIHLYKKRNRLKNCNRDYRRRKEIQQGVRRGIRERKGGEGRGKERRVAVEIITMMNIIFCVLLSHSKILSFCPIIKLVRDMTSTENQCTFRVQQNEHVFPDKMYHATKHTCTRTHTQTNT